MTSQEWPIPVIYDTDIGTDIDDTWALALILASPELDLKLVVTDSGDTRERARIAAKFLEASGRDDVPIGIGVPGGDIPLPQGPWAEGYDLAGYAGGLHEDGVGAMIEAIRSSPEPMTLIVVGPAPNIPEALRRDPSIVESARVVAMSGSVDRGYVGAEEPAAEYNVRAAVVGSQAMYGAGWDILIAPLDTAGQVQLRGELYQRLVASEQPMVKALLESYRIWEPRFRFGRHDTESESSVLYDALAVALAYRPELCAIEELRLEVTADGFTRRAADGGSVRAALSWPQEGRAAFERFLVDRLLAFR
ncbi:MAG: nucleoside hydrolase [Acidobacteriota bacterium]|nr:nucleoside hydrolase [Acidobacteriota bacterium]